MASMTIPNRSPQSKPMFAFPKKRWRVQRDPSKEFEDSSIELEGSSMSLGKIQLRKIASSLNASSRNREFMSFSEGHSSNRSKKSFFRHFNSEEDTEKAMTSSRHSSIDAISLESSIHAEESKDTVEEMDDFVIPIELLKNKRSKSKKKKTKMDNVRSFLRKSLKLPLDKKHQQWSRYSFDASSLSFRR